MAANEYVFVTEWTVPSTPEEVYAILDHATDLPRWWPAVYLGVDKIRVGDARGIGDVFDMRTKGWLPYTIRWNMEVVEKRAPHGFTIRATGDFVGSGVWSFQAVGDQVAMTFDWRIVGEKPLFRYLSFALKPIFSANHRWAMAKGLESLKLELARLYCQSPEQRALIPAPPGPTFIRRK